MDGDTLATVVDAIRNNRTDIVRSLVQLCKDNIPEDSDSNHDEGSKLTSDSVLNSLSCENGTLLHFATQLDNADIVRALLSSGADPSIRNDDGKTAYDLVETEKMAAVYADELLRCAAKLDASDSIRKLIEAGVPVNSQDFASSGNSALHWAASFGNPENVQCLLDYGAKVNIPNSDGSLPLHDAVSRKNRDIIQLLLNAGANPFLKCIKGKFQGKSSIDLANEDPSVKDLFATYLNSPLVKQEIINGSISSSTESLHAANDLSDTVNQLSLSSTESSHVPSHASLPLFPNVTAPPSLITDVKLHLLWPLPQHITQIDAPCFNVVDKYSVTIIHDSDTYQASDIINIWKIHADNWKSLNIECFIEDIMPFSSKPSGKIICYVSNKLSQKPQSYKIVINSEQIRISASDLIGLHYGLCTMYQLFYLYQKEDIFPSIFIEDAPMLYSRAALLDLTPGARKPTLDTLKATIKILSILKYNELHLYFRLGLKHETKWPYSNCDLIEITSFCHQYFITPVLAVDIISETSIEKLSEYSLNVQSIMYLFSTKKIHIGPNLSLLLLEKLLQENFSIQTMLHLPPNCLVYLCSNGFSCNSKVLNMLPFNVILIEFSYQETHDYDSCIKSIVTSGLSAFVGVGTSTWGSIAGCPESTVNNMHKAAQSAMNKSASGFIIADWKTSPHHAAFCFSWPGLLLAAGLSWNPSIHVDFLHSRLPELLNHHVFQDNENILGYLIIELGRLEAFVHRSAVHGISSNSLSSSVLHQFLIDPDNVPIENFSPELIQQSVHHLKKFKNDLQTAKPECFQKGEIVAELQIALNLMLFSCRLAKVMFHNGSKPDGDTCGLSVVNIGISNLPPVVKTDLANKLLPLIELFCGVWLSRNLPCGLHASLYLFNAVLHKLIPNSEHYFASAEGFVRHNEMLSEQKRLPFTNSL